MAATNTARKIRTEELPLYEKRLRVIANNRRINRLNALKSGIFIVASLVILLGVLGYYLSLQSSITNSIKHISKQESRLNELRLDNDENYSRITGNINLDRIRTVAIQELGMRYADEGQIITFNGEGSDYLIMTGELPE